MARTLCASRRPAGGKVSATIVSSTAPCMSVLLQVLVVATPLGNQFFSTVPLSAELWILTIGLAVAALLIVVAAAVLFPSIAADD